MSDENDHVVFHTKAKPGANLSGAILTGANLSDANIRMSDDDKAVPDAVSDAVSDAESPMEHAIKEAKKKNKDLYFPNTKKPLWRGMKSISIYGFKKNRPELHKATIEAFIAEREKNPELLLSLRYADLTGIDLEGMDLRNIDLKYAQLGGANLCKANLTDVNLKNAFLEGALLIGAKLEGANLQDANLDYAYLQYADLTTANLSGVEFQERFLSRFNFATLTNTFCIGTNFNSPALFIKFSNAGAFIRRSIIWDYYQNEYPNFYNEITRNGLMNAEDKFIDPKNNPNHDKHIQLIKRFGIPKFGYQANYHSEPKVLAEARRKGYWNFNRDGGGKMKNRTKKSIRTKKTNKTKKIKHTRIKTIKRRIQQKNNRKTTKAK
jgi:uncharacterized protein YjbI with pentapeptide repeats